VNGAAVRQTPCDGVTCRDGSGKLIDYEGEVGWAAEDTLEIGKAAAGPSVPVPNLEAAGCAPHHDCDRAGRTGRTGKRKQGERDTTTEVLGAFHDMLPVGRMNRQSSDAVERSNHSARCLFEVPGEEF
jgi:hypothetical protein